MQFTLKQLRVFKAIDEFGSTTAAGQVLALSQSAVSSSLQQLEENIGQQLFDRIGRQLILEQVRAIALTQYRCRLLDQAAELEQQFLGNAVGGVIDIGASFTIANHVIVDRHGRFSDNNTRTSRYGSRVITHPELQNGWPAGDLDFGLIESPVTDPCDFMCAPWLEDELVIFSSPDHPLGKKDQVH